MMEGSACLLGKTQLGVTASACKELSVLMWMTVYLLNSWGKGCGISVTELGRAHSWERDYLCRRSVTCVGRFICGRLRRGQWDRAYLRRMGKRKKDYKVGHSNKCPHVLLLYDVALRNSYSSF